MHCERLEKRPHLGSTDTTFLAASLSELDILPVGCSHPGFEVMEFFTEFFVRPKWPGHQNFSVATAVLNAMGRAERAAPGGRPADFPRIARR